VAAADHCTSCHERNDDGAGTTAYDGEVWSRIGVVTVVLAVVVSSLSCADDGPDARTANVMEAAVTLRVSACRTIVERGAGLLVAPGQVLTSAHLLAGATAIQVIGVNGVTDDARVVAFDPVNDLAVVQVPASFGRHVPLAADPPDGAFTGDVVLFRQDRAVVEPVEILRRVTINTDDIYRAAATSRPGYELRARILPGDSGGVIVHGGQAVGVVWSRSRISDDRAWAIDPIRGGATITEQLADGVIGDDIVLDRCA
jgi:S1-C subfamily serine protease